ncbi:MAG: alpha-ketoglutarate-dependent dioxygenase AlkB [Acidimicrobiales bacterium]
MKVLQGSLFAAGDDVGPGSLVPERRVDLGSGAWFEMVEGWMRGADTLFHELADSVPWREERRWMYERMVDVPRLIAFYGKEDQLPAPPLQEALDVLREHYAGEGGEALATAGLCLYRDAHDSVAWHGDRIGRNNTEADTLIAIVTLGAPRRFLLRPKGGGRSVQLKPAAGDLLVLGGSTQRTWEHCVPKSTQPVGPRMSVQYRPLEDSS